MAPERLTERPTRDHVSFYPLSFEEALRAALAIDPNKIDAEEAEPHDDGS